jgi:NADPH2:quinone reductase
MRAIVVEQAGGPEVLQLREWPKPEPCPGWVLIQIKAFGLNRSEMFTRQGHSPSVRFPRVLGIECVGVVEAAPGGEVTPGQTVAALMGGLGRAYDGGYAEYTLVPARQVIPVQTDLPWATLAALPETYLTAWGSLFDALEVRAGQTLLVRGGTSSVGMAAIDLAKGHGLTVLATTRNPARAAILRDAGADEVIIDNGQIAEAVRRSHPDGVERVLDLVGTVTLLDSLRAAAPRGIVCDSGILGNAWTLAEFEPLTAIPSTVKLTAYSSETVTADGNTAALQQIVDGVAAGRYHPRIDRIFRLEDLVEAHRSMEESQATGKLVVVVE